MKRSEQKIQDTWKMEDMFISDEAWEKDFEKATKMIPKILNGLEIYSVLDL